MKGLLQRAVEKIAGESQPHSDPSEHKDQLYEELEARLQQQRPEHSPQMFRFTPERNDAILPLAAAGGAVVIVVVAVLLLVFFSNLAERDLVTTAGSTQTTEGRIIAAVRAETEEQLREKDQELTNIQERLATTIRERDNLVTNAEEQIQARQQELEIELDAALAAERERLRGEGFLAEEIETRLGELRAGLETESQRQIAEYTAAVEADLAERERQVALQIADFEQQMQSAVLEQGRLQELLAAREAELAAEFADRAQILENERSQIQNRLDELEAVEDREAFVFEQILASYGSIENRIRAGDYSGAEAGLSALRDFLADDTVASLESVAARRSVDEFVLGLFNDLIEQERLIAESFPLEKAQLSASIRDLQNLLDLERNAALASEIQAEAAALAAAERLSSLSSELNQTRVTLAEFSSLVDVIERLKVILDQLAAEGDQDADVDMENMVLELLSTKVLLRRVVSTGDVAEAYPTLYDDLERYLTALESERFASGAQAATIALTVIMDSLARGEQPSTEALLNAVNAGLSPESLASFLAAAEDLFN